MDHLARIAMKNAANCVKYGELQGSRNRNMSNAYCGPVIHLPGPRLSEGLLRLDEHLVVHAALRGTPMRVLGFTLAESRAQVGASFFASLSGDASLSRNDSPRLAPLVEASEATIETRVCARVCVLYPLWVAFTRSHSVLRGRSEFTRAPAGAKHGTYLSAYRDE
jgi:hypothetical protein